MSSAGVPLAMGEATQHEQQAAADYARLGGFNIRTVRESVGWRLTERAGNFDLSAVEGRARAAAEAGVQVLWTLCHYGMPSDVDVMSGDFVSRYVRFAKAVASRLLRFGGLPPVYTPFNEISFLAWAICDGGRMRASCSSAGAAEVRRQLVRAAIAACEAILAIDPRARFMHTDPLIHVVPPEDRPELAPLAAAHNALQYEAWDMLCGAAEPQLGGDARLLDLVGVNYYCNNQWELESCEPLGWRIDDERRRPLAGMLEDAYRRYGRPLVISETSHVGVGRGAWVREVARECVAARRRGVPIEGICLYPIIDHPDADFGVHWTHSGLWDLHYGPGGRLRRNVNGPYADALVEAQEMIGADPGAEQVLAQLHVMDDARVAAR